MNYVDPDFILMLEVLGNGLAFCLGAGIVLAAYAWYLHKRGR